MKPASFICLFLCLFCQAPQLLIMLQSGPHTVPPVLHAYKCLFKCLMPPRAWDYSLCPLVMMCMYVFPFFPPPFYTFPQVPYSRTIQHANGVFFDGFSPLLESLSATGRCPSEGCELRAVFLLLLLRAPSR